MNHQQQTNIKNSQIFNAQTQYKMSQYYPPYLAGLSGIKHVTVNIDLEGLATKDDLKSIICRYVFICFKI